jgi:hypothetical protein
MAFAPLAVRTAQLLIAEVKVAIHHLPPEKAFYIIIP